MTPPPDNTSRDAAVDRLQRALGLTDEEMELARSLPSHHWADCGVKEYNVAKITRRIPAVEALVTDIGHAKGWLPDHLSIRYDQTPEL
jgi:hypothetical protein